MAVETEEKILNAALKLFSKNGYESTRTMAIAVDAGVSEKTLFRKFKTKRNLYEMVVVDHHKIVTEDFRSRFKSFEYESSRDFLKAVVMNLASLCEDNYEIIHLVLEETIESSRPVTKKWIEFLSDYIKENLKNEAVDYPVFTMTILFFIYSLVNEKKHGRAVVDFDEALGKFIDNLALVID